MKIAVLGGGLSGVLLARLLKEKGHECHLYEGEAHLGGLCRSRIKDGFVYDLGGGHILHSKKEDILSYILDTTGKENWHLNTRNTKIYYNGRYIKYPFENGLNDLSKEDNFECLMGYIDASMKRKYHDVEKAQTFQEWIYSNFGKGIAEKFMIPYNKKIWNYDLNKISNSWVEGRVPFAPLEDVVKASIGINTEGYKHQSTFYYPKKGGFQFLIESLSKDLETVYTDTKVANLERSDGQWIVNCEEAYDDIISTLPIQELLKVTQNVPPFVLSNSDGICYNGVGTVFIALKKDFEHDYSWIYLPHQSNGPANRITFLSNYSKENAPSGCGSILAEVTFRANANALYNKEKFMEEVVNSLAGCDFFDKDDILFTDCHYFQYAYPVYDVNFDDRMRILNNFFEEVNLKRFGRFATYDYFNVDHIVEKAIEYVNAKY